MPTKYTDVNGYATYYYHTGATTLPEVVPDLSRGRKILFIHGAGSNGHTWHRQIDAFGTRHSPIALDLPGHGRSAGVEGLRTVHDYADFVVAFLDKLKIKSAVILGHSMGGAIAMDLGLRHAARVEALILSCTAPRFNITPDRIEGYRAITIGRAPQAFNTEGYSPKTAKENFDVVREGWMEQIKTDPRVRYTDLVACDKTDLRGDLEKISSPTMILACASRGGASSCKRPPKKRS